MNRNTSSKFINNISPFWISTSVLLITVGLLVVAVLMACEGYYTYSLDDTYIHLSIARNLIQDGIWGVSRGEYVPAASSPLYILLLACAGAWEYAPLLLNIAAGGVILWLASMVLQEQGLSRRWQLGILLVLIFVGPLPLMICCGMEATIQTAITLAFVAVVGKELTCGSKPSGKGLLLLILAVLMCSVRYEGAFVVGVACVLMVLPLEGRKGRWGRAMMLGIAGALPILMYGAISIYNGHHFLPNSIAIKGGLPAMTFGAVKLWIEKVGGRFYTSPFLLHALLAIFFIAWLKLRQQKTIWNIHTVVGLLLGTSMLVHMVLSDVALYRYETYLLIAGFLYVGVGVVPFIRELWGEAVSSRVMLCGIVAIFFVPFVIRTAFFTLNFSRGARNIYEQQIQMARFLELNYHSGSVAANDIGAITYFTRIHLLDVNGIGTTQIVENLVSHGGRFIDKALVSRLAEERKVQIAIVYDVHVGGRIPTDWVRVGTWTIQNNFVCADETVSFYAVRRDEEANLRKCLAEFVPKLPPTVLVQMNLPYNQD